MVLGPVGCGDSGQGVPNRGHERAVGPWPRFVSGPETFGSTWQAREVLDFGERRINWLDHYEKGSTVFGARYNGRG